MAVIKTVKGATDPIEDEFEFTVTLYEDDDLKEVMTSIDGEYGEMTFEKGVATFSLKDGGSVVATDLPMGTTFTVEEKPYEGYKATYEQETEEVEGLATTNVTCTNTVIPAALAPETTPETTPETPTAKTGDSTPILPIALIGAAAIAGMVVIRRRSLQK